MGIAIQERESDVVRSVRGEIGRGPVRQGALGEVQTCGLAASQGVGQVPRFRSAPTIRHLELDVTEDCVLRCEYCFRHGKPSRAHRTDAMSPEVARAAVDWLIRGAKDAKDLDPRRPLNVYFFGGEPLMQFGLIKDIVGYAEKRGAEVGLRVHCGATTNMVLISDEVMDFWRKHKMSLNTSIDGTPESHDRFRRFPDGRGSSACVERAVPKVLAYRPQTTARCTLHPENAGRALEDVKYLLKLGYQNIPLIPIEDCEWTEEQLSTFRAELAKLSDFFIEKYRRGEPFYLKHLDTALKAIISPQRPMRDCGAGTVMALCDPRGDLWPCHRFPGYDANGVWKLGNVFDGKLDEAKRATFLNYHPSKLKAPCDRCLAVNMCACPCLAANWAVSGDLFTPPEAHCRIYRMYFEEGMRVHYILKSEANPSFLQRYYSQGQKTATRTPSVRSTGCRPAPLRTPHSEFRTPSLLCAYTGFDEAAEPPSAPVTCHPSPVTPLMTACAESVVSGRRFLFGYAPVQRGVPCAFRDPARAQAAIGEDPDPCPCDGICQQPCDIEPCQTPCDAACQPCDTPCDTACEPAVEPPPCPCDGICQQPCDIEPCQTPCDAACQPCDTPCDTGCEPAVEPPPCPCDGICQQPCDIEPCQTPCDSVCQPCDTPCETEQQV